MNNGGTSYTLAMTHAFLLSSRNLSDHNENCSRHQRTKIPGPRIIILVTKYADITILSCKSSPSLGEKSTDITTVSLKEHADDSHHGLHTAPPIAIHIPKFQLYQATISGKCGQPVGNVTSAKIQSLSVIGCCTFWSSKDSCPHTMIPQVFQPKRDVTFAASRT